MTSLIYDESWRLLLESLCMSLTNYFTRSCSPTVYTIFKNFVACDQCAMFIKNSKTPVKQSSNYTDLQPEEIHTDRYTC